MGSGKSTVSERLAEEIDGERISIDQILDEKVVEEWEGEVMSQRNFIEANGFGAEIASRILGKGTPVVFDGNFYWRSQIEDLICRLNHPHFIFTLKVPLSVCIERNGSRTKAYGEEDVKIVFRKSTEFDYGINIDATKSLDAVVAEIASRLPRDLRKAKP